MDLSPQEFEKLLCEFCKQDLPESFTVEHNIRELGGESGTKRQIDTKIKGRLGISNILICGEAKNWNEEVGSETIDALVGKYFTGEIRANKVILFSNHGYSSPAIQRAKLLGIELLEPLKIDNPILPFPHIICVGYLGKMFLHLTHRSPQKNLMSVDVDQYIILKGKDRISFQQFVFRNICIKLQQIDNKSLMHDFARIKIEEDNVLYELKQKEGYKYNANFSVDVSMIWDYFVEYLPTGVLHHVNSGDQVYINLQGEAKDILNKVLLSPTKINYETKEDCSKEFIEKKNTHLILYVMTDPDRHKTNPSNPIFKIL